MKPEQLFTARMSKQSYLFVSIAMLVFLLSLPSPLRAQDDEAAPTATTTAPKADKKTTLWEVIVAGGIWMLPLAALSFAGVALAVNNAMILQRKKLAREDLLPGLLQQLAGRDIDGALAVCAANPTLMTNILAGGLHRITTDEIDMDGIREGIDQTGKAQMATLIKPVNYLSNISAVAPMLGLLGTVSGMIKAFSAMSLGASANAEVMAANISEALVTTGAGLFIAIPSMLVYFYFKNNFMETLTTIDAEIGRLLNALRTGAVSYGVDHNPDAVQG